MPGLDRAESASTDARLATAIYAVALGRSDSQGSQSPGSDLPSAPFSRASTPPMRSPNRLPPPIPTVPEWDASFSLEEEITPGHLSPRVELATYSHASRQYHVSWTDDAPAEMDTDHDLDQEQNPGHENEQEEYSIYLPTDPAKIAAICRFDIGLEDWYPVALEEGGPSSLIRATRALAQQACDPQPPNELDAPLPPPQGWREQTRTRRLGLMHGFDRAFSQVRPNPTQGPRDWEHAFADAFGRRAAPMGREDFSTLARASSLEVSAQADLQLAMEQFSGPAPAAPPPPRWGTRGTIGSEQSVGDVLASFAPPPSKDNTTRQAQLISPFEGSLTAVPVPVLPPAIARAGGRAKRPRPLDTVIGASPNTRPRTRPRLSSMPVLGPQEKAERAWAFARHMATVRNGVRWPGAHLNRRGLASATVNRVFIPPEQGGVGGDSFGLSHLLGFGTVGRNTMPSQALPAPRTRDVLLSYLD